ncbi:MAG: glycosyltransferase [Capnocytophaga sp.]|nr:glycosyltransferase [Capnocytophaga sp.]
MKYSIIVPVYNRPDEIKELLDTMVEQSFEKEFEVVIIEDGSSISSKEIVEKYKDRIQVKYYYKENSGPGDSRNYGMRVAEGNYFIILDSDCLLPKYYLKNVDDFLQNNYVDCFGGADAATTSFTTIQKAINYAMTSFFTTGGIRGSKKSISRFEPRSFNMGISKEAFEKTGGFGKIHPGEDPDLTIRLWKIGYCTSFIEKAFVYHKRRISWKKFFLQVNKFGQTRPILNYWHPQTRKLIYWLPSFFVVGFFISILFSLFSVWAGIFIYAAYFLLIFIESVCKNKSLKIGILSVWAVGVQFFGYGIGFLYSTFRLFRTKKTPEELFPKLFFK